MQFKVYLCRHSRDHLFAEFCIEGAIASCRAEQSKIEIVPICEALAKTVRQETFDLAEEQVEPHTNIYKLQYSSNYATAHSKAMHLSIN